jgi:hypothetical protein
MRASTLTFIHRLPSFSSSDDTFEMAKRKSTSGKKMAKKATLGSSTSSGKQSAVGFDFEPTDQKIPKEEEPGKFSTLIATRPLALDD